MFKLKIMTPEGLYFDEEVSSLTLKLITGYVTILSKHHPMIGIVDYAPMHLVKNNKTYYYALHGGVLNIKDEEVVILTNAIENAKDIDVSRALSAKKRAEQRLASTNDIVEINRAKSAIVRALSRIDTVNKYGK